MHSAPGHHLSPQILSASVERVRFLGALSLARLQVTSPQTNRTDGSRSLCAYRGVQCGRKAVIRHDCGRIQGNARNRTFESFSERYLPMRKR